MSTTIIEDLLQRNQQVAATWQPFPTFAEQAEAKAVPPSILIVTCIDPRCDPAKFLNLQGEALVIRNVCGHVAPIVPDIVAVDYLLNFKHAMVIHHTDCGATHFTNAGIMNAVQEWFPNPAVLAGTDFGAVSDLPQSVRDDLKVFKSSGMIRQELREKVKGFVFDIKTGVLSPVE